jgi:hypothetical protein
MSNKHSRNDFQMVQYQNLTEEQQTKLLVKHLILDGKVFSDDGTISDQQIAQIKKQFGTKGFSAARDTEVIAQDSEKVASGELPLDLIASLHKYNKEGFFGAIDKKNGQLAGYIDTSFLSDQQFEQYKNGNIDYSKLINQNPKNPQNRNLYIYSFAVDSEYKGLNSPVTKMLLEEMAVWLKKLEGKGIELSSFTGEPISQDGLRIVTMKPDGTNNWGMQLIKPPQNDGEYGLYGLPPEKVKLWVNGLLRHRARQQTRSDESNATPSP